MMIIVGVFKQTGLFEYLAIWAAQRSGGQPYRLMVLLVVHRPPSPRPCSTTSRPCCSSPR